MRVTSSRPPVPAVLLTVMLLAACGAEAQTGADDAPRPAGTASVNPTTSAPMTPAPPQPSTPDPAVAGANELGHVPVLMYHQVMARPKGIYDITPRAFRAELERLAREGYVPVTAADYAAGQINIPAGCHPVVLTFDDSTRTQLTLDDQGRPAAGTAVAILLEVAARRPGFTPTATFYVNRDPFADPGGRRTLRWLVENGFEIGNHTLDHASLRALSPDGLRRQLAGGTRLIEKPPGVSR